MKKTRRVKTKSRKTTYIVFSVVVSFLAVLTILIISKPHILAQVLGISTQNPIQIENARSGTTAWRVTNPSPHGEIQAYVGANSVNQGENVPLYVSVKEAGDGYIFDMYRLGYYGLTTN